MILLYRKDPLGKICTFALNQCGGYIIFNLCKNAGLKQCLFNLINVHFTFPGFGGFNK